MMKQILIIVDDEYTRHQLRLWLSDPRWQLRVIRDSPSAINITTDSHGPVDLTLFSVTDESKVREHIKQLMELGIALGQLVVLMSQSLHEDIKNELFGKQLQVLYTPLGHAKILAAVEIYLGLSTTWHEDEY